MTDHDKLFKRLLTVFLPEFMRLFYPRVSQFLDESSIEFLDKELFSDTPDAEKGEADLVVKARFSGSDAFFLIHLEPQSYHDQEFQARMFRYFVRLYEQYKLPVYPIAVFSYNRREKQPSSLEISFPNKKRVLLFEYEVLQLSKIDYRLYIKSENPITAALVGKMKIEPPARARVKLECIKMLSRLNLEPAKAYLVAQFIDTYQKLTKYQEREYQRGLEAMPEKEEVMEMITSWKREGIEQGRQEGRKEGLEESLHLMLQSKYGKESQVLQSRIKELPIELLRGMLTECLVSESVEELEKWLESATNRQDVSHQ